VNTQKNQHTHTHTQKKSTKKEMHTHTHTSLLVLKQSMGGMKLGAVVMHFPFTFHTNAILGWMVGWV
jgi:hypothetical protein